MCLSQSVGSITNKDGRCPRLGRSYNYLNTPRTLAWLLEPTVAAVEAMFASFVRSCCGQTCLGLRLWATSCLGSLMDLVLAVPEEHRLRLLFILNFGLV